MLPVILLQRKEEGGKSNARHARWQRKCSHVGGTMDDPTEPVQGCSRGADRGARWFTGPAQAVGPLQPMNPQHGGYCRFRCMCSI